ncbi:MAG: DMT family transporter [Devosia sp.]|uniref:DMT family transporter n=2 Tax=Devosia sp. TaxID=1871048 RepID=UPI003265F26C
MMSATETILPKENIPRAMVLILIVIGILGLQDAVSKLLVQTYSPFQVTMMRYWAFAAFSLILVARQAPLRQALRSKVPGWQVVRGLLLMGDIWLFALALQTVPLAELQSISLIYPLLVTLFAIPLLGERVGMFRLIAVAVGFLGAMVIVRPGGLPITIGAGFAVASSTLYALYIVVTRKVAQMDSAPTSMVYASLIGLVLSTAVGVFYWQPIWGVDLALMVLLMFTTTVGHGLMMLALSMAPASVLQPFNYFSLPWAIFLSFAMFGHLIDPISLGGAAIIVAAGLVVVARERVRKVPQIIDAPH